MVLNMKYILGIDQGGSNTRAAVMDTTGEILGYARTDGTYFPRDGMNVSLGIISKAVEDALINAQLKIDDICMIAIGITGIDYEGDDIYVQNEFRQFFGVEEIHAFNDCVIAYYGGATDPFGAVICAGTGINAAFFKPDNIWVMSDYMKASIQGGSAIARRAIEAMFEAEVKVWPETKLRQLFLELAGVDTVDEVLKMYITDRDYGWRIIKLPPEILKLALEGDFVSRMVLEQFSNDLCNCFIGGMKKMDMMEVDCTIVLAGSVYKGTDNYLRKITTETLSEKAKNATIINAAFEPVVGACIMGVNKAAGKFDDQMRQRTITSATKFGLDRI